MLQTIDHTASVTDIVIGDGGSRDRTLEVVKEFSEHSTIPVRIVACTPGMGGIFIGTFVGLNKQSMTECKNWNN